MDIVAVGIGGFIGAILRYSIGLLIPEIDGFPFATLSINLLGSLLLAFIFTFSDRRRKINPKYKLAIGTGILGAFTTFSAFSVEALTLLNNNQFLMALLYVFISIVGGIGFTLIGVTLAAFNVKPSQQIKGETE